MIPVPAIGVKLKKPNADAGEADPAIPPVLFGWPVPPASCALSYTLVVIVPAGMPHPPTDVPDAVPPPPPPGIERYEPKVVAPPSPPAVGLKVYVVVDAAAFVNVFAVPPTPPAPMPTLTDPASPTYRSRMIAQRPPPPPLPADTATPVVPTVLVAVKPPPPPPPPAPIPTTASKLLTPVGRVQVPEEVKVSVTTNDPVVGVEVAMSSDFSVAKVLLLTAAVVVSLMVNSAHAADDEMADPPAVVVPEMLVHVVLS